MKLLSVLLRKNISRWQFIGFGLAGLVGAVIVLFSLQAYKDVKAVFSEEKSLLSDNYLVISKPVGTLSTLLELVGAKAPTFSETEIKALKQLPAVGEVAGFRAAHFSVYGSVSAMGHSMQTEMFVESVPEEFLDLPAENNVVWSASVADKFVPVVIPRSYLDLYNFGFATSRGLPQLTEGAIGQFVFQIHMGRRVYDARIVGFSSRLNTILVPDDFLEEANCVFSQVADTSPSRLIVRTERGKTDKALLDYIEHKGYLIADDSDESLRVRTVLFSVIYIAITIGLLVALLAGCLLFVSLMLLVEKNSSVFRNLYSMGYTVQEMSAPYRKLVLLLDSLVWLLAAAGTMLLYPMVGEMIRTMAPQISLASLWVIPAVALVGFVLFFVVHLHVVRSAIARCCK